ncbi:Bifunctional DNA primase/polymerase (plasmid) [Crinalium epipsammum PCC 9333]|uniref:Bifunctional DNA primase/polymerase n=1 Tax=Crinalium epipsammum PCC 9333 TaxID=1173022 RepID=K9W5K6_9CYAN|nr:bifunctional DNA primase/polymerase [Crinalium epipsammum]AFZ15486.1 Bifunctional DNA primase/polymerase [Crinalium epipsammum PCC 9333]
MNPQDWKLWQRVPNSQEIADALKNIPAHWNLTPLHDKAAFRENWQTEPFINHNHFTTWLLDGEEKVSSKGKTYRAYISGYGLRTGDSSNGLIAIDVDGASAEPVLEALLGNGDLPKTVSWTSGKPGRRQLLFQVPDEYRGQLVDFNRSVITEHKGVKTADGEILELRYNKCQSVLPPSRHPQTGAYHWINSPSVCEVAIAPNWLCELLIGLANLEKQAELARAREALAARARADVRRQQRQQSLFVGTPPLEIFLTRNDQDLINSGAGQGNRDDYGFKLAANIIATCDRLQVLGIPFEGDGERLFEEYGNRCSPPLTKRDINRIWKSASKKSKPSLNDEQLEKRYSYWQYEQKKDFYKPNNFNQSGDNFCVSSEKQSYYCFHCKASGNAVRFLVEFEKKSFTDTVLGLAEKHQIPVEWDTKNSNHLTSSTIESVKAKTDIYEIISERIPLQKSGNVFTGVCPFHKSDATPFESISDLFKNLKHRLDNSLKGFGKQRIKPKPKPKPQEVKINLPTPENYQKLGHPHIIYDGAILNTWQTAKELGYRYILDKSSTGVGKSHASGDAIPAAFGVEKIFNLAADHRNPTTLPVEVNYKDLPPRHNGFKKDETRLTPLLLPFLVHPKKDEKPDTPGNCFRTPLFHNLASKNLSGIEQSNESPVCATCHLAGGCQSGKGEGYGFRFERRQAFESDRLRAHPDSMPSIDEGEYPKWMGIWDEAGRLIKTTKQLEVKLADFDQTWAELEAKLPQHHQALTGLRQSLRQFLTKELKQPYYGWSDAEIREKLPQAPDDVSLLADDIDYALHPDLIKLLKEPDNVDFRGNAGKGVSKATRSLIRSTLRAEAYTESTKNLDSVLLNWLPQFLRIWGGEKGAFRCQWNTLTVASRDEKHADIVKAFNFNVFLDATVDPDILALRLGIPRHELLVIEKSKPSYQNLRIIQVNGFGQLGKKRSDSLNQQVQLFQAWLRQKHSDIDFIDWLAFSDFAHFREGRGSNQFINHSALASFGTPYQNIGSLQMEYQTLTGKSPDGEEFQAFVDAHVQEEIVQEVGRMRSHLDLMQQKTFYFVADYDIRFLALELPGVTIESVDVVKLCPEAAGGANQTKWAILQAYKQLSESASKITTTTVGAVAGVTQGCVSKIAQDFGGWKELEKLLRLLLSKLYSVGNNSDEPDFDIKYMADKYLPLALDEPEVDALAEVKIVAESFGWQGFEKIIELMPLKYKAKLLAVILNLLPSDVGDELKGAIADLQIEGTG